MGFKVVHLARCWGISKVISCPNREDVESNRFSCFTTIPYTLYDRVPVPLVLLYQAFTRLHSKLLLLGYNWFFVLV